MILGSQFYSIRHMTQNEADIREAFRLTKEMGYHAVQISGISPDIRPELLKGFMAAPWEMTTKVNRYTLMDDAERMYLARKELYPETLK